MVQMATIKTNKIRYNRAYNLCVLKAIYKSTCLWFRFRYRTFHYTNSSNTKNTKKTVFVLIIRLCHIASNGKQCSIHLTIMYYTVDKVDFKTQLITRWYCWAWWFYLSRRNHTTTTKKKSFHKRKIYETRPLRKDNFSFTIENPSD